MLFGTVLHHWLATGLAAVSFILFLKAIVGPHLPAGAKKLVLSV